MYEDRIGDVEVGKVEVYDGVLVEDWCGRFGVSVLYVYEVVFVDGGLVEYDVVFIWIEVWSDDCESVCLVEDVYVVVLCCFVGDCLDVVVGVVMEYGVFGY